MNEQMIKVTKTYVNQLMISIAQCNDLGSSSNNSVKTTDKLKKV